MRQALKTYQLELKVCGPVFIGDGTEIQKKEYVFLDRETVGIVDSVKLYTLAKRKRMENEFERFMVMDTREDLRRWAERNRITRRELESCLKYKIHTGDIQHNKGKMQIMACMKDPYGNPYIPGSSIKGMLRTILLCNELKTNSQRYRQIGQMIKNELDSREPVRNRKQVLDGNAKKIEEQAFYSLERTERKRDAVNDKMSGIVISDSESISIDNVILCQKWEKHREGECKTLNLLRECLRPGTVIKSVLTVDETVNKITPQEIQKAVNTFYESYYDVFQKKFAGQDRKSPNTVFLGGGSGFVSKTVLYSLFEENEAIPAVQKIFQKTGVPKEHKHFQDVRLRVSPHILKCTRYQGKEYMMGQCELKLL